MYVRLNFLQSFSAKAYETNVHSLKLLEPLYGKHYFLEAHSMWFQFMQFLRGLLLEEELLVANCRSFFVIEYI